jgi:predicted nuclease of predicted toxin-antitoxin system
VKILLDQCVPENLKEELSEHQVSHLKDHQWERLKNGDLLKAAEKANYDCFLTCDLNMRKHERVSQRKIAVLEFTPQSWPKLKVLVSLLNHQLKTMKPGEYKQIDLEKLASQIIQQSRKHRKRSSF